MAYKVELRYLSGWDDAEWTEEGEDGEKPLRFQTVEAAQSAIDAFLAQGKVAVLEGDMDTEGSRDDYRIVHANE